MKRADLTILYEDETCEVWCRCGAKPFISADAVYRCPECGRGYRTEFVVYEYEPGETDPEYEDSEPISMAVTGTRPK